MSNPNNCEACDHKKYNKDDGHCYMFEKEPTEICHAHSARKTDSDLIKMMFQLIGAKT